MFYILNTFYYRKKGDLEDIVEEEKIFQHDNPIIAREECFSAYQSHIDVMYDFLGKEYTGYKQAKKDLQPFFYSEKERDKLDLPIIENGIGIFIYFVYDDEIETVTLYDEEMNVYKGIVTIHGIENEKHLNGKIKDYHFGVKFEYDFYKKNGFEMRDIIEVPKIGKIMWTPLYEEKIKSL